MTRVVSIDSALLAGILTVEVAQVLAMYRLQRRVSHLEAVVGVLAGSVGIEYDTVES